MKKSSIYGILSIVLIVGMFFTGCASKNNASQLNTNVSNLPIHQMHASFVYDTDNIREAVGICDYVFVAKVVSCDGTEYRNVITTEDEKGNPKEVGSPYTNYTIQVLENIKGELITDKPIPIVKQGGISEKQDAIYLFENDSLPSENSIYIFLAYAQEDGSLLIGIPGYRARIRPIVSRITIHWPSFYNVVTGKTLALPNLIALQHIPLSPAGVIAKRPAPIALPNSCAAEWRMAPDAVFSPYASVRYFTPHMVHSQYNLL